RARQEQVEADLRQRGQELEQTERHLESTRARLQESQRLLLQASAALAAWYLRKEEAERHLAGCDRERALLRQRRQDRAEQVQENRGSWRAQQEQAHARELAVNDLRHRLDALCARLQEDYQLDLAELYRNAGVRGQRSGVGGEAPAGPGESQAAGAGG